MGYPRAPLNIAVDDPLAVDGVVFRDDQQRIACGIAVKATFRLLPDECVLESRPLPIFFEEQTFEGALAKGIARPADVDPAKHAPEFVVVGSGYSATGPVDHVACKVTVGDVTKAVDSWVPRRYRVDGTMELKGAATRFPLDFGAASGGTGTDNPVGVSIDRVDSRGRHRIPQIVPASFNLKGPGSFVPIAGLGPLDPKNPIRQRVLRDEDKRWLSDPTNLPQPIGFDARYFQSSLPDQWLPRAISASEWIALEGLHPSLPRLTTRLPGLEPSAFVNGKTIPLTGDMLVLDTDLGILTLTWRGRCELDPVHHSVSLSVQLGPAASEATSPRREPPPPPRERRTTKLNRAITADEAEFNKTAMNMPAQPKAAAHDALPFANAAPPPRPSARGSFADSALPFQNSPPASVPPRPRSVPAPSPGGMELPMPAFAKSGAPSMVVHDSTTSDLPASESPHSRRGEKPPFPRAPTVATQTLSTESVAAVAAQIPPAPLPAAGTPARPMATLAKPNTVPPPPPVPMAPISAAPPAPLAPMSASVSTLGRQTLGVSSSLKSVPPPAPMVTASPMPAPPPMAPAPVVPAVVSSAGPSSLGPSALAPAPVRPLESKGETPSKSSNGGGFGAAFGAVKSAASLSTMTKAEDNTVKNASDAAAERERLKERRVVKPAELAEDAPSLRRRYSVDLLGFEAAVVKRVRSKAPYAAVLKAAPSQQKPLGLDGGRPDLNEDRDRLDVTRVLSYGKPLELSEARRAVEASFDDDLDLEPPLLFMAGEARPVFDEVEALRTATAIAQPFAQNDKKVQAAVAVATEALAATPAPSADKCVSLLRQLEQSTSGLSLPPKFLTSQVDRTLLESRHFKRRQLWGLQRFRVDFQVGSETLPCYVDDALSSYWPLLPVVPIVILAELRPREDASESSNEALVVRALGRVLASRAV